MFIMPRGLLICPLAYISLLGSRVKWIYYQIFSWNVSYSINGWSINSLNIIIISNIYWKWFDLTTWSKCIENDLILLLGKNALKMIWSYYLVKMHRKCFNLNALKMIWSYYLVKMHWKCFNLTTWSKGIENDSILLLKSKYCCLGVALVLLDLQSSKSSIIFFQVFCNLQKI